MQQARTSPRVARHLVEAPLNGGAFLRNRVCHSPPFWSALGIALLLIIAGCRLPGIRTYSGSGRIVEVVSDQESLLIDHGDIKGFMPAMTMLFSVEDVALLKGLQPNDLVRFELTVTPRRSWISKLERIGHTGAVPNSTPEVRQLNRQKGQTGLKSGQPFPTFTLIDQDERRVGSEDFRGKAVAITFIFTRCPLPEYCPRFSRTFAQVQQRMAPEFKHRFHLLSISFDPQHDAPRTLKEYGRAYGSDFRSWSYLTGSEVEIKRIAGACGVRYWNAEGGISHTSACAVVTPSGTLYKLHRGNDWTADQIVSDLTELLDRPSRPDRSDSFR